MATMTDWEPARPVARSRLMHFFCWLVRVDPEILADCPTIDRFQVISKAVLLLAVAGIALVAWGGFFLQFWPLWVALPLTLLVVTWVVIIDQVMGSSN